MSESTTTASAPVPQAPATIEDAGLGADQISQLIAKSLYAGESTGLALADRLRLPYALLEPLIERARSERLVEVRGATGSGTAGYRYALTDLGRDRARQYIDANGYIGPAPVPLFAYVETMRALAAARGYIDRARLRQGFSHLVVSDKVLEQLGPAVNAGNAVFLYGPPGDGKTVLAEGMGRALGGDVYIPHAIDVDGQTITMFDPINHDSFEADEERSLVRSAPRDRRWVRIRRPVVMVGGELTLDMLDLTFNPLSKFHEAPIQLKANGGVFLVDDFGRQRMRPQDLLNRWIVPLESRVDYLTLHTGKKFQVPFDVLIVFATNLDPASLADEAFLRRIPYKIAISDPTVDQYSRIFELNCRRRNLRFHQVMVAYLQRRHYRPFNRPMRACHPRDLLDQVTALCRYQGREPTITRELLDAACGAYFVDDAPEPPSGAVPARRICRFTDMHARQRRDVATDVLARVLVGALFVMLSVNLLTDFVRTRHVTGLLLLVSESLVIVLMVLRRRARLTDRSAGAAIVTAISIAGPPLLRVTDATALAPDVVTATISALGLLLVIAGKLTLGRSFGIIPANRGVVVRGPYLLVRHPIYAGYLVSHLAFVAAHPQPWNVIVIVCADTALIVRALLEERVLGGDEAYRAYCARVVWHLVPGLF